MAEPFIGEIKLLGFGFAPKDYAKCDGAMVPIYDNQALYALMGATYGGNGTSNFQLPDMRGRCPVGEKMSDPGNYGRGMIGGQESVPLSQQQLPGHTHIAKGSSASGTERNPSGSACFATSDKEANLLYGPAVNLKPMNSNILSPAGQGQGHNNMQPYLAINFCIALYGIFPSRT